MDLINIPFPTFEILVLIYTLLLIYFLRTILHSHIGGNSKVIWGCIIVCLPVVGILIYMLIGKKN